MANPKQRELVNEYARGFKDSLQLDKATCRIPRKGNKIWFNLTLGELTLHAPIAKKVIFSKKHDFKQLVQKTVIGLWITLLQQEMRAVEMALARGRNGNH